MDAGARFSVGRVMFRFFFANMKEGNAWP